MFRHFYRAQDEALQSGQNARQDAVEELYNSLPGRAFLTAAADRGGEFARCDDVQNKLGINLFFADPHSPHQRGSSEHANGLLREFYPKGVRLENGEQTEVDKCVSLINKRPRKCLNWKSAEYMFLQEAAQLTLQS